jgi:molybdate transport repressor ModE-like protein
MERGLEQQLVQTRVGGRDGGGAELTPAAVEYIQRYYRFSAGLAEEIQRRFAEAFGLAT